MTIRFHAPRSCPHGVALIEALVALAVTAVGMLALVGLQGVLRGNSDFAKQRSEAVRIAQAGIEDWRAFGTLAGYASFTVDSTAVNSTNASAVYTLSRSFTTMAAPQVGKTVVARVTWTDRSGEAQSVQLTSAIAGIAPDLAATLGVPPDAGSLLRQPYGRRAGVPTQAVTLSDDRSRSAYQPPGASTGVIWTINNGTGLVNVSLCSTPPNLSGTVSSSDLASCATTAYGRLLAGYVRYALNAVPTEAVALNPPPLVSVPSPAPMPQVNYITSGGGTQVCSVQNVTATSSYTQYVCVVPVAYNATTNPAPFWSGSVVFTGAALATSTADNSPSLVRMCRYTSAVPYPYVQVTSPLAYQNYLAISAGSGSGAPYACPTATTLHQPTTP